jgi:hypothetical protein
MTTCPSQKMSDTASKVAGLETRFEQMEMQFLSLFSRLEAMLSGMKPQSLSAVNSSSIGGTTTPVCSLANHPTPVTAGGSISESRATGTGS